MSKHARLCYFDHASLGRPGRKTIERVWKEVARASQFATSGTLETLRQFKAVDDARRRIARFVHADLESVLLVGNTTQALGMIATALPLHRDDNVLIADVEFMGVTVVWRNICRRLGVELVPVPSTGGQLAAEHFSRFANSRTRAIVISTVQEVSGCRADVETIREVASRSGAFLIVDGIQEVGAVPVFFKELGVDAYCAGGHKWMRSPFGLGFACLSQRLLEVLDPSYHGYLALAEPEMGWDRYMGLTSRSPFDLLPLRQDAVRLETGGFPNWLGAAALDTAASELESKGQTRVWARIRRLRKRLVAGLSEMGVEILGGVDVPERTQSGIVTFHLLGGAGQERLLGRRLSEEHIQVSLRYVSGIGGVRVAVHESNNADEVDYLLDVVRSFLRGAAYKIGSHA